MPYPGSHHYDETFESEDVTTDNSFMFATQQQHTQSSLYPTSTHDSPHSWPPFDQTLLPPFQSQPLPYRGFPTPAPYPAPRLSSPLNTTGGGHVTTNMSRLSLAGSLDPATGIFYRTPEHPRLRTAQACEKCRTRKAKCSGEHPSCKRCINRGLVCEYAKEGRVRGPNKTKNAAGTSNSMLKHPNASGTADLETVGRTSSATSSVNSVEQTGVSPHTSDAITNCEPPIPRIPSEEHSPPSSSINTFTIQSPSRVNFTPLSQHSSPHPSQISQDLYPLSTSAASSGPSSRRNSLTVYGVGLGEQRASRPRPPNLGLDTNNQWRQGSLAGSDPSGWINQTNAGVNLTHLAELPMDLQNPQQQYERQCFVRQQHQRYLQEQQRPAVYQQHSMLPQNNAPVQMDYQSLQTQPSSLPIISASALQQRMNPGMDPMFQTQYQVYTPTGDLSDQRTMEYAQGLHPEMQTQGYPEESQAASMMTHQESYQRASTGLESAEQGLHPSLSRVEKRLESFLGVSNREEHTVGSCSLGANHPHRVLDNGDQSRWA